jgi:DNA (cytosine-5)-methyltransferase 1
MGPAPYPVDEKDRLAPEFVGFMMGFPAQWLDTDPPISRTQKLKALGNAVVPHQALLAWRMLMEG